MLNLQCPINDLGYGVASLNLFKALVARGVDVALFPMGDSSSMNAPPDCHDIIKTAVERAKTFNPLAPSLKIWHQFDLASRIGKGKHFAMPIFELDTLSDIEKHHVGSLDHCIVNSEWARQVVMDQIILGDLGVSVVPLGVDSTIFNMQDVRRPDKTIFLNMGKWEIRKGHDVLCTAFNEAFEKNDNVELWMCCHNPFYEPEKNKEWEDYYLNSKLGDKIRIIPRQATQNDVATLMNRADCGVFPSRGEGWNLEALEMMACGKHIIATDYSAHTEFCTAENSRLIAVTDVESAHDGKWFNGQGNWAKFGDVQMDSLVIHMRDFHDNNYKSINEEGLVTARKFSWANAAQKLESVLYG
jgi:glycosyltransferase involved in cell wall biosynthesis